MRLRTDQTLLLTAGVISLAFWIVPFLRPLILPLDFYNTHVHELAHALATIVTGGKVGLVEVYANGSGITQSYGGNGLLIASAGYVGSAVVGGLLLIGSRTPENARRLIYVAAGFLLFSLLFFLRGELFGILSCIAWIAALVLSGRFLSNEGVIFAAKFLGIQQCLTSLHSVVVLLGLTAFTDSHNDAQNMEAMTGLPALLWSVLWAMIAIGAVVWGLKVSWEPQAKRRRMP